MKFLFSIAIIFAFVLVGFSQENTTAPPEAPIVLSITTKPFEPGVNPEAIKARNRGIELALNGDHELSVVEFTKAIDLDPKFADAYNRRGAAYSNLGDHERAIEDFRQAIIFKPDFDVAYMNRAGSFMILKK